MGAICWFAAHFLMDNVLVELQLLQLLNRWRIRANGANPPSPKQGRCYRKDSPISPMTLDIKVCPFVLPLIQKPLFLRQEKEVISPPGGKISDYGGKSFKFVMQCGIWTEHCSLSYAFAANISMMTMASRHPRHHLDLKELASFALVLYKQMNTAFAAYVSCQATVWLVAIPQKTLHALRGSVAKIMP